MRLIDADALVEEIKQRNPDNVSYEDAWAITCIEHAPTIEPEQRWIPCSERLPDYDGYDEVITTVNGRHGDVEYINGVCTNVQYDDIDELWYINDVYEPNITVTAWMPLPEPYREDGEADD